jgi:hypothetical protein
MPRYFFDLRDDLEAHDPEGAVLADLDAALARAQAEAREMLCACVAEGKIDLHHHIKIRDEDGQVAAVVEFGDVLRVIPRE